MVVYSRQLKPWMIIECKEMNVALDKKVFDQALRYNLVLQVPNLVITNGSFCMAFDFINNQMQELETLPVFK